MFLPKILLKTAVWLLVFPSLTFSQEYGEPVCYDPPPIRQSEQVFASDNQTFCPSYFPTPDLPLRQLTLFTGIEGSKQPQDFGANAHLGLRASGNFSAAIASQYGIGFQLGTAAAVDGNAVQVFELLGASTGRTQSFTTLGLFQRNANGFSWGVVYDYLYQESFDDFSLSQWRLGVSRAVGRNYEIGATVNLADRSDRGRFNNIDVELEPIEQLHVYLRRYWETGVQTSVRVGVADGHSEENVLTGTLPPKSNPILFGAELYAPLSDWMAITGETNLMMPADTGTVDAYLGIEISPQRLVARFRENQFRPFFRVASNSTLSVDLNRR